MKHLQIYENFKEISPIAKDFFEIEFKKILHNQTIIRGPIYNEEIVNDLLTNKVQNELIDSCYYHQARRYVLDQAEISRAECAERNIKKFLGDKIEELELEITYYRPLYIKTPSYLAIAGDIQVNTSFNRGFFDNALIIKSDHTKTKDEIIQQIKEFAAEHKSTHILPIGPRVMDDGSKDPIKVLQNPESDFWSAYHVIEPSFIPINEFDWKSLKI